MTLRTTFRPVTALEHDPAGVGATGGAPARLDHVRSIESSDGRASVEQFWLDAITSDGPIEGLMIKVRCSIPSYLFPRRPWPSFDRRTLGLRFH
jgi:hypothetical protein